MSSTDTVVSKDFMERLLDTNKLQYCYECGICNASCPIAELLGKKYNPRILVGKIASEPEVALSSEGLWLCAWCYLCHRRCNQALKLPEIFLMIRTIAVDGGYTQSSEKAFRTIAENVPLPLITALVCFHPERAGLKLDETLERIWETHEAYLKREKAKRAQVVSEERIAVIGSGPAGLTAAYELSRKGYGVTIFESLPEAGGMLRKCIPQFRLPRRFLDREIQSIKDLGVEIKTGVTVGHDISFSSLWREGYNAFFVSAGAHGEHRLNIEGEELERVVPALEFLWNVNSGENAEIGRNVVVIGGGNVAVDAARTAIAARAQAGMGAEEVTILYRRSREEMPAIPWETKEAEKEGVRFEFLVSPKRIVGEEGQVKFVECVRMELGEPDESGRRRATPIAGSEFKRYADMVILAVGETPDSSFLPKEIDVNEDGTIWVDPMTMETTMKGTFAGGDIVTGSATVIEAVCAGKRAAESIHKHLKQAEDD